MRYERCKDTSPTYNWTIIYVLSIMHVFCVCMSGKIAFVDVGYYYPTLEIVGVDNRFIRQWAILIS